MTSATALAVRSIDSYVDFNTRVTESFFKFIDDSQVEEAWALLDADLGPQRARIAREIEQMWVSYGLDESQDSPAQRTNPRARSMVRNGKRYAVRKDSGTKAHRQEIIKINAKRSDSRKPLSVRSNRANDKFMARSGAHDGDMVRAYDRLALRVRA